MKTAVLLPGKYNPTSKLCSNHIAAYIAKELNAEFIHHDNAKEMIDDYDILIIVNFPFAFCAIENEVYELVSRCRKLVWAQNDYTIAPPATNHIGPKSPIRLAFGNRKEPLIYWTTVPEKIKLPASHYVNWNLLGWKNVPQRPVSERNDRVIYYGSYRKDRSVSFDKYFKSRVVDIACTTRNRDKFAVHCGEAGTKIRDPLGDIETEIQEYCGSLYIEDESQHGENHSPPSRFYEAISSGTPLLIDSACLWGLKKAGIRVEDEWIVFDHEDLNKLTKSMLANIQNRQRINLHKDYLGILRSQINEAYRKVTK